MTTSSAARAILLAIVLVALGFLLGMGFQTRQYAEQRTQNGSSAGKPPALQAPVVRSLRISPDDRLLAFSAAYDVVSGQPTQAGRFVFDLKTYRWHEAKSPAGWQDSITQWSRDGKRILFTRERIPRPAGEGEPGLFQESVQPAEKDAKENAFQRAVSSSLSSEAEPVGEKAYAGFWTPDGQLVMKTWRESKSLFLKRNESARLIDRSPGTYYQNRAILENRTTAYYVVRDVSVADGTVGVFRIQNGQTRQLGSTLADVVWAYFSENARWLVICRIAANGNDWRWSLFRVSSTALTLVREADIPADAVAVYWSPDFKTILGAAGKSLWRIAIPSLQVRQLGDREDWNADDAVWLEDQNAVIVAAAGRLWKVDATTGKRTEIWKFPDQYWR